MSAQTCIHCGITHDPMDWHDELLHDERECEVKTLRSKLQASEKLLTIARENEERTAAANRDLVSRLHEYAVQQGECDHRWEARAGNMGDEYCRRCGLVLDENGIPTGSYEKV